MAGIINSAINKVDPLSSIKGYNAATAGFDEEKDTVEGRLNRLTNNSQLKTAAKGDALKFGSGRGMINSNMTAAAGVDAFYNRATPIASQDAAASLQSKQFDTDQTNTGFQFSAGEVNKGSMQERQGQQAIEQIGEQGGQDRLNITAKGEVDSSLQKEKYGFENTLQTDRYGLETNLQTGLQVLRGTQETANISQRGDIDKNLQADADAAAAARLETQGEQSIDQIGAKGEIDLTLQEKADLAAAERLVTQGEQTITQITARGDVDLSLQDKADLAAAERLVTQGEQAIAQITSKGAVDKDLQADADLAAANRLVTQGTQAIAQIEAKGVEDRTLQDKADLAAANRLVTQGNQAINQIKERGTIDKGLQSDADAAAAARLDTQGDQSIAQIGAQGDENIELENVRNTNQTALQDLKNTNDRLISANGAAATLFSNSQIAISNILANPDMTTAAKQSLVNTITRELENGLTAIGTFSDVDVTELIGDNTPVGGGTGDDGNPGGNTNYDIPKNYNWSTFINKSGNEDLAEAYASQTWADSPKQWAEELWVKGVSDGSDPRFMAEFGVATTS